jgi:hypothetical protein
MKPRMNFYQVAPETIKALSTLEFEVRSSGLELSLPHSLQAHTPSFPVANTVPMAAAKVRLSARDLFSCHRAIILFSVARHCRLSRKSIDVFGAGGGEACSRPPQHSSVVSFSRRSRDRVSQRTPTMATEIPVVVVIVSPCRFSKSRGDSLTSDKRAASRAHRWRPRSAKPLQLVKSRSQRRVDPFGETSRKVVDRWFICQSAILPRLSPGAASTMVPKSDLARECRLRAVHRRIDRCSNDEAAALRALQQE